MGAGHRRKDRRDQRPLPRRHSGQLRFDRQSQCQSESRNRTRNLRAFGQEGLLPHEGLHAGADEHLRRRTGKSREPRSLDLCRCFGSEQGLFSLPVNRPDPLCRDGRVVHRIADAGEFRHGRVGRTIWHAQERRDYLPGAGYRARTERRRICR